MKLKLALKLDTDFANASVRDLLGMVWDFCGLFNTQKGCPLSCAL